MTQMNGTDQNVPSVFFERAMINFEEKNGRKPAMIVVSPDVLRDVYKEFKRNGMLPANAGPFSLVTITRKPFSYSGVEIVICGGEKRFALI